MKETKIIPYRTAIDEEENMVYTFLFEGSKKEVYNVNVTIDELNDNLLLYRVTTCECWDFRRGREKDSEYKCKHLNKAISVLNEMGVTWREK